MCCPRKSASLALLFWGLTPSSSLWGLPWLVGPGLFAVMDAGSIRCVSVKAHVV